MSESDNNKGEKIAGGSGAIFGTAGVTVLASGSSAAGISAGLASAGSLVGGGMAAGVGVVTAIPIVSAAAFYGLYKWLKPIFKNKEGEPVKSKLDSTAEPPK